MEIKTNMDTDIIDVTALVEGEVKKSGVESGICLVYTFHTTTALVVNEGESGLLYDILKRMSELVPRNDEYRHCGDDNAHAHIQACLLGNSVVIPVEDNCLALGTWQRILFLELDGPRRRKISVKVIP